MRSLPLLLVPALLLAVPAAAQEGPSFDCRKAASPVEKAICADRRLAALDRRIAGDYAAALQRLDAKGAESLREDQRGFLRVLSYGMERNEGVPEAKQIFDLHETLKERAAFLTSVGPAPQGHWVGTWSNYFGGIDITAEAGGLVIAANGAAPVTGNWVCDVGGRVEVEAERLTLKGDSEERGPGWTYQLARDGDRIVFSQTGPAGESSGAPVCGHNGSMNGSYLYQARPAQDGAGAVAPQRNR